ncbi:MAG: protein kinase [Bryobacterales bacterium]|nr:protein kinase [Bryobacterales bacterium]
MVRAGRYVVHREIGRGAMGVVYLGEDPAIARPVAIKTVNFSQLTDPRQANVYRERLIREASSAGILQHPAIIKIYDVVQADAYTCVVMEYVDGVPLAVRMSQGPIPRDAALALLERLAEALDHAHHSGVIHRDIKPANILLTRDGQPKIADFGVARLTSRETTVGFFGTPAYMSPEQIRDEKATPKTDQFAFAALAFELISQRKPFDAEQISSLIYKILQDPAAPTGLGHQVDRVFERALAKDPAGRFATCREFVAALRGVLAPSPEMTPIPPIGQPKHLTLTMLGGALGVAAVLGGIWAALPRQASSDKPAPRAAAVVEPRREPSVAQKEPAAPAVKPRQAERVEERPAGVRKARRPPLEAPPVEKAEPAVTAPVVKPEVPKPVERAAVRVSTTPTGARIIFDGDASALCFSPCARELTAGAHHLTAFLDGYRLGTAKVDVPGYPEISIILSKAQGTIVFDASLSGAAITINGRTLASPAPTEIELPTGDHHVKLTVKDVVVLDRTLTVKDSGRILVRAPAPPPQQ